MCGMCGDVYGGCDKIECGALEPVDPETGQRRWRYMMWFSYGQKACEHVAARHAPDCPTPKGGYNPDPADAEPSFPYFPCEDCHPLD